MRAAGAAPHTTVPTATTTWGCSCQNTEGEIFSRSSICPLYDLTPEWQRLLALTVPLPKQLRNVVVRATSRTRFVSLADILTACPVPPPIRWEGRGRPPERNLNCCLNYLKRQSHEHARESWSWGHGQKWQVRLLPSDSLLLTPRAEHVLTHGRGAFLGLACGAVCFGRDRLVLSLCTSLSPVSLGQDAAADTSSWPGTM